MDSPSKLRRNSTMDSEEHRFDTFSKWSCPSHCLSPPILASKGFYYSGEGDIVICYLCEKRCIANNYALRHSCPELPGCPPVLGAAGNNIPVGHGSLSLTVGDLISSGSSIVGSTPADRGIRAAEDTPSRPLAFFSGCKPSDDHSIRGVGGASFRAGIRTGTCRLVFPRGGTNLAQTSHRILPRGRQASVGNISGGLPLYRMDPSAEELARHATFSGRPNAFYTPNVGPLRLAKNGFFYSGVGDMIICCACKMCCGVGDNPLQKHGLQSPLCPFVLRAATENIPLGQLTPTVGTGTLTNCFAEAESERGDFVPGFGSVSLSGLAQASGSDVSPENMHHGKQQEQEKEYAGMQVEDDELDSNEVIAEKPEGTQIDALMDREEVKIVLRFMGDCDSSRDHLKTLVTERLSRGEECLVPAVLLDAVFKKYP